MIDLREPNEALVTLGLARRSFEHGGPLPVAVRELLVELADALADGGPLELGVSSRRWLRAKQTASRAVARLRDDTSPAQCRDAKRALRKLRRVFASASRSPRLRARGAYAKHTKRTILLVCAVALGLIACAAVVGAALRQGQFEVRDFLAVIVVVAMVPLLWFLPPVWLIVEAFKRELARADAEALPRSEHHLSGLALNERLLFAQRITDGRVAVATDRRVLLAEATPRSGLRASGSGAATIIARSMHYVQITSVSRDRINSGDSQNTQLIRVTLNAGRSRLTADLDRAVDAHALLAIVERRRRATDVSPEARGAPAGRSGPHSSVAP